jgi:hypothetical protein
MPIVSPDGHLATSVNDPLYIVSHKAISLKVTSAVVIPHHIELHSLRKNFYLGKAIHINVAWGILVGEKRLQKRKLQE